MGARDDRERTVFILLVLAVTSLASSACGDGPIDVASSHDDPPVSVAQTGAGALKLTTMIQLGNDAPILVEIDSGSDGLRVDRAVLPSGIQVSGSTTTKEFGGGRKLIGPTAMVPITIGEVTSPEPVVVQVVETIECGQVTHCSTDEGVSGFADLPRIQGIMGVGLNSPGVEAGVFNPLLQMSSPFSSGWVFDVTLEGGSLTLGSAPAPAGAVAVDIPSATPFPDGQPGWNDHALPLCWQIGDVGGCGPGVIDTGGPTPAIPLAFFSGSSLSSGTVAAGTSIVLTASDGTPIWTFTAGASPEEVTLTPSSSSRTEANAGIGVFLSAQTVGYDVLAGQVWVLPPS